MIHLHVWLRTLTDQLLAAGESELQTQTPAAAACSGESSATERSSWTTRTPSPSIPSTCL